ncbi:M15 family metallopeptidase [Rhodococcus sp. IEGM 1379]|uniref:M15 family metallopeptidase n=1 Tax=Rhodococcus sp. IEGM 1379 TaxID=3047086 RepID=UPI0024B8389E|nr:M15 family metallopeptidase [Rhodococcus sp. IEGM 1379]MDI9914700.1 M15 family metallopeptidase [Rhodococcus sp. IEGM 1379]
MPSHRGILCLLALGVLGLTACSYTDDAQPKSGNYLATQPDSGPAGGEIEDGISPSDTHLPALARLDTALLAALHSAVADAQKSGVAMHVTSGWRSAAFQQRLWDNAVVKYGSASEAAQWVHPPNLSKHVSGQAVDIGPTNADDWLIQHGSDYGLCQTYANEMWHFELATTPGGECPPQLSNPSDERAEG